MTQLAKTIGPGELVEVLEEAVDKHSLGEVLTALEAICYGKADHLTSNWQDVPAGKVWARNGRKIGRVKVEA